MVTIYQVPLVDLTSTVTRDHPKAESHTVGITTAADQLVLTELYLFNISAFTESLFELL